MYIDSKNMLLHTRIVVCVKFLAYLKVSSENQAGLHVTKTKCMLNLSKKTGHDIPCIKLWRTCKTKILWLSPLKQESPSIALAWGESVKTFPSIKKRAGGVMRYKHPEHGLHPA